MEESIFFQALFPKKVAESILGISNMVDCARTKQMIYYRYSELRQLCNCSQRSCRSPRLVLSLRSTSYKKESMKDSFFNNSYSELSDQTTLHMTTGFCESISETICFFGTVPVNEL